MGSQPDDISRIPQGLAPPMLPRPTRSPPTAAAVATDASELPERKDGLNDPWAAFGKSNGAAASSHAKSNGKAGENDLLDPWAAAAAERKPNGVEKVSGELGSPGIGITNGISNGTIKDVANDMCFAQPVRKDDGGLNAWAKYSKTDGTWVSPDAAEYDLDTPLPANHGITDARASFGRSAPPLPMAPWERGNRSQDASDFAGREISVNSLALRSQLLQAVGAAALVNWILRTVRSRPGLGDAVTRQMVGLSRVGPVPLTTLGVSVGLLVSRLIPALLSYLSNLRSRYATESNRKSNRDSWNSGGDPWGGSHRPSPGLQVHGTASNPWGSYTGFSSGLSNVEGSLRGSGPSTFSHSFRDRQDVGMGGLTALARPPGTNSRFRLFFEGTREEYIREHVCFRIREDVAKANLSDNALFQMGQKSYGEQASFLQRLECGDAQVPDAVEPVFRPGLHPRPIREGGLGGRAPETQRPRRQEDRSWWPDDEYDDPPFWWRNKKDLFFEIPITAEEDLTALAPEYYQWWDPVKVAESENFVAVAKPAGMYVVTDDKGLWEVSNTNFVHVAHQRFPEMGSSHEPNQRGICHRLDSHTSGVQIFGRSWEAFRHFTKENSSHRTCKEYVALVDGRLGDENIPGTGLIDIPMHKWKDFDRREFGSVVCAHEGLAAVTKYKALRQWHVPAEGKMKWIGRDRWFTLVQLRILSGRTHQIRVHMAFIGYPLIGDIKYNGKNFEIDSAFVPRIFLHSLKMEVKEFDGSVFDAHTELAPDLQAVLKRLDQLSAHSKEALAGASTLPGMARMLEETKEEHSPPVIEAAEGMAEAFTRQPLVHRCLNCKCREEAVCIMIQRRNEVAMSWKLVKESPDEERFRDNSQLRTAPSIEEQRQSGDDMLPWGPGMLWVPTLLQMQRFDMEANMKAQTNDVEADEEEEPATSEELGARWGKFGTEWCWAHNGTKQNGWFRLCRAGFLASKWGIGRWELCGEADSELLLVTFNGLEHGLRLLEGEETRFDVVSMRRIKDGQESIMQDVSSRSRASEPTAPAVCTVQGWPGPAQAESRPSQAE